MIPTRPGTDFTDLKARAGRVRLLLMDCDGVLTDGRLYFSASGEAMKVFDVQDGQGIALWHDAGGESGIITGRGSEDILSARALELRIKYLKVNSKDKLADLEGIAAEAGVAFDEIAFVGDDVGDIPALRRVGLPIAVANAVVELSEVAICRTERSGGSGAIREVCDYLISSRTGRFS